ncbi:FAD-dependent oxidoreductase [Gammaproteobacteria bacterium]|nr:FAD-dependent oxidoreductase [Gammaproteobacteria bacterium]
MIKIGLIGVGRFGLVLKSKITKVASLLWEASSDSDYTKLEEPDWIFIATPNVLHYEQAVYFLEKGINVFIEKPAVLNSLALKKLITLSKSNNALLYISDVFLFREDIELNSLSHQVNTFKWFKERGSDNSCVLDRLTYHHLYLIFNSLGSNDSRCSIVDAKLENDYEILIKIEADGRLFNMQYKLVDGLEQKHVVFGKELDSSQKSDAVLLMLDSIIKNNLDVENNQKAALWSTEIVEKIKERCFPKVNVIGGGIFGCTAAIELANRGYNVTLYEKKDDVLGETSSINQYRVHRGYHYPRSAETALQCNESSSDFIKSFRQAILPKEVEHFYAIAKKDSMTSARDYLDFLKEIGLEYEITENIVNTSLTVKVIENLYDPMVLKVILKNRLFGSGVRLKLNHEVSAKDLDKKDFAIAATYSNLNDWLTTPELTQYELCEKPLLKLPLIYKNKSIVIMDGPFMCIDPFGDSGYHVMGNVVHAIHSSNIGFKPETPKGFEELLNNGIISNPPITNIDLFLDSAKTFFPDIDKSEYIGSMFTFRAVKPNREHDDARPTLVNLVKPKLATIFSGKTCTSIIAAKKVADLAQEGHD